MPTDNTGQRVSAPTHAMGGWASPGAAGGSGMCPCGPQSGPAAAVTHQHRRSPAQALALSPLHAGLCLQ